MAKNILVTGIGGNVGQGILRNLRALPYKLEITGTNTEWISAGNHLCDRVFPVPFASEPGYIDTILQICRDRCIDLIIPSTDFETYYLSRQRSVLPAMACADHQTNEIFLDKYLTWCEFQKYHIPFALSALPSQPQKCFNEIIVKPRTGRGSRDICVNPESLVIFSDDYLVQEYLRGREITTAFYITRQKDLLGHITFARELSHGATVKCEVVFDYDADVTRLIHQMTDAFHIVGPCNIQSIVLEDLAVVPFEINARISGTNSIRSHFGFNDVKYIVDEYVYDKLPEKPVIKKGCALRMLTDIIYIDASMDQIKYPDTCWYTF